MAFISEISFLGTSGAASEFVEIVLRPGEDPADFIVSAYDQNGALHTTSGISGGEVTLSSLTGTPDPENPAFTIYVVPLGLRNGASNLNEASAVSLTYAPGGVPSNVVDFYSATALPPITATAGAASGAASTNNLSHFNLTSGQSYQWDGQGNSSYAAATRGNAAVCLTGNSKVRTKDGAVRVRDLRAGDLVWTADHGYQPLRWIGKTRHGATELAEDAGLCPVQIAAGALGPGLPRRALTVSRQHRIVIRSSVAIGCEGNSEVLLAAHLLLGTSGVDVDWNCQQVSYFHLLFDRHELIDCDGALVESLLIADRSRTVLQARRARGEDCNGLFLRCAQVPARPILSGAAARELVRRICAAGGALADPPGADAGFLAA